MWPTVAKGLLTCHRMPCSTIYGAPQHSTFKKKWGWWTGLLLRTRNVFDHTHPAHTTDQTVDLSNVDNKQNRSYPGKCKTHQLLLQGLRHSLAQVGFLRSICMSRHPLSLHTSWWVGHPHVVCLCCLSRKLVAMDVQLLRTAKSVTCWWWRWLCHCRSILAHQDLKKIIDEM